MTKLAVFANPNVVARGWYWALPAAALVSSGRHHLKLFGRDILLYRGTDGVVHAVSAYCPHMGADLSFGEVEADTIRCPFHGRRFSANGRCVEVPGRRCDKAAGLASYAVGEAFGMIWIHTDPDTRDALPHFPALHGQDVTVKLDPAGRRGCHPTLILGGGVDEEHFNFVHRRTTALSGPLKFVGERRSAAVMNFRNRAPIVGKSWKTYLLRRLYGGTLRYEVTYWHAASGFAELGWPALPLYSIFAYRPTADGTTEGLNIYVTPRRRGMRHLISVLALRLTATILRQGGAEDTVIQNSIRFRAGPEALDNPPFAAFVQYVEEQPVLQLGGTHAGD